MGDGYNRKQAALGAALASFASILGSRREEDRRREEQEKLRQQQQEFSDQELYSTLAAGVPQAGSIGELEGLLSRFQTSNIATPEREQNITQMAGARREQLTATERQKIFDSARERIQSGQPLDIALQTSGQPEAGQEGIGIRQQDIGRLAQLEGQQNVARRTAAEQEATKESREAERIAMERRRLQLAEEANRRAGESQTISLEGQKITNEINRIRLAQLGQEDTNDPATAADAARIVGFVFQANDDARNTVIELSRDPAGLRQLATEAGVPFQEGMFVSDTDPRFDKLVEHVRDNLLEQAGVTSEVRTGAMRILQEQLGGLAPQPTNPAGGDNYNLALQNAQRMVQTQGKDQVIAMLENDRELAASIGEENVRRIIETIRNR